MSKLRQPTINMPTSIASTTIHTATSLLTHVQRCRHTLTVSYSARQLTLILMLAIFATSSFAQEPANRISNSPTPKPKTTQLMLPKEAKQDPLPKLELSKDILHKVLSAEAAIRAGDWQSAYITFLRLAQQSRDPRLAKRAADLAMQAQSVDEAAAAVRLWRELSPNSSEASQYYLSILVVKNDYPELEKFLSAQLLSSTQQETPLLIHHAQRLLARTQDPQRAFQTLKNILAKLPVSLDSHIALAHAAKRNQDKATAQQEAGLARTLDPESELAVLTLAQVSETADALTLFQDFLHTHPNSQEIQLAYASTLIEGKQLDAAKQVFLTLLKLQTTSKAPTASSLYAIAAIDLEQGKIDSAENYFLQFLDVLTPTIDPSNAYINLAQIALLRQDKKAADQWLAKVDYKDGNNPIWMKVQLRRAQMMAADQGVGAARRFLQTLHSNRDHERLQILLTEVQILRDGGQHLEALTLSQLGLGDFPNSAELLYHFALLAETLKRYDDMELALRQLIQIAPDNAFAFNALGYSFADRNIKLDEAQKLIERAVQLAPEDAYILDSLGWVKFRQKQLHEAEQILRRAVALKPDLEITLHLAEVLWSLDKKEDALKLFTELKTNAPASELIDRTLQRLAIPLSPNSAIKP